MARANARPRDGDAHRQAARQSACCRTPAVQRACIENIDFASHRKLDRRGVLAGAQGDWLKADEHLIIAGPTGTRKTWLGCAFGRQAERLDYSALYVRRPRLFEDLAMARLGGRFPRPIDKLDTRKNPSHLKQ